jgi:hypothetical protein
MECRMGWTTINESVSTNNWRKHTFWDNLRKGGSVTILVYSVHLVLFGLCAVDRWVQTDLVYLVCIFFKCRDKGILSRAGAVFVYIDSL